MTNTDKSLLDAMKAARKAKNDAFNKLSPDEKRVAIARDVLYQILSGFYVPTNMTYFNVPNSLGKFKNAGPTADLQAMLDEVPQCNVCAIGAMFASCVREADEITIGELLDDSSIESVRKYGSDDDIAVDMEQRGFAPYLEKFFSFEQLVCMEQVFEGWYLWHESVQHASDRLMLIMMNVVRNNGAFILEGCSTEEQSNIHIFCVGRENGCMLRGYCTSKRFAALPQSFKDVVSPPEEEEEEDEDEDSSSACDDGDCECHASDD